MANPRQKVMFNQIDPDRTSYMADKVTIIPDRTLPGGCAQVGKAVMLVAGGAPGTVALTQDATFVLGVIESCDPDGVLTILTGDYVQMPASAAMAVGQRVCGALSTGNRGYVRAVAPATLADVAVARGVVVDATDTLNPWVFTD